MFLLLLALLNIFSGSFLIEIDPTNGHLYCWLCQSGFTQPCAEVKNIGKWTDCGFNSSCYEAIVGYNYNSLLLVERGCFTPSDNDTNSNFCNTPLQSNVGELHECHSCTNGTNCNTHIIQTINQGTYGYFLMNQSIAYNPSMTYNYTPTTILT